MYNINRRYNPDIEAPRESYDTFQGKCIRWSRLSDDVSINPVRNHLANTSAIDITDTARICNMDSKLHRYITYGYNYINTHINTHITHRSRLSDLPLTWFAIPAATCIGSQGVKNPSMVIDLTYKPVNEISAYPNTYISEDSRNR